MRYCLSIGEGLIKRESFYNLYKPFSKYYMTVIIIYKNIVVFTPIDGFQIKVKKVLF